MNTQEALNIIESAEWLADKIVAQGDYAKEASLRLKQLAQMQRQALESQEQEPVSGCGDCHACLVNVKDESGFPVSATRMILCPECGNKRCPKASNHRYDCTNSNDTGQVGSIYRTHPAQPLNDYEKVSIKHQINDAFNEGFEKGKAMSLVASIPPNFIKLEGMEKKSTAPAQPLSEQSIKDIWTSWMLMGNDPVKFARAIEKAHGIGE